MMTKVPRAISSTQEQPFISYSLEEPASPYSTHTASAMATYSNQQWLKDGTAFARWEKAQMQCMWCKKVGNYYYNHPNTDDTQEYNWKVTTMKEPGTIICNDCHKRESPPHVQYLRDLDKKGFSVLGEQLTIVAEFAYDVYARFSPQRILENQISTLTNDEFPAGQKIGFREQIRRTDYRDMTVGGTMNYIHEW